MTERSSLSHVVCGVLAVLILNLLGCAEYIVPKKIVVDGTTYAQNSAGINAAIQAAGSNSEVVLMPGSYAITAPIVINNLQNMTLRIASGTKLLAVPEDFNGAISMLSITRSSFVRVLGGKGIEFKGFGTPRDCITINAPGLTDDTPVSNVEVSGITCTGTLDGIDAGDSKNFQMNTNNIEIGHNFVSGTSGPGQISVQATVGATVHDNVLENPRIGQDQIVCSTDVECDVYDNTLRGFVPPPSGNPQAALNVYFCQQCSFHDNTIHGVLNPVAAGFGFGDIYCDTCFDSSFKSNRFIGGMWGITCEICRNVIIHSNFLEGQLDTGIQLFGSTLFRSINHLDSLIGLRPGAGVVISKEPVSASGKPRGLQARLSATFTQGVVFEQDVTPALQPDLRLQIYSSRELPTGALGFEYCGGPRLQGPCNVLPFEAVPARVWILESHRYPVKQPFDDYRSYAVVALKNLSATVLSFRDLEADRIAEYADIEGNRIIRVRVSGISIYEGNQHYSVAQNTCQQVGYGSSNEISACVVISDVDQGPISYLLQYGTVEGNQATAAIGAATAYGIRAYALGNSVNDSLLVQANRWDVANPTFFSRITNLILGPSLQAEDPCAQDNGLLVLPHDGCHSQARKASQPKHP